MTADTDAKLIEEGRKLFAGEWQFVWASPSIETLPPMTGVEVAFAGRSNVGKSSLINALTMQRAGAHLAHAGPHPGTDLLRRSGLFRAAAGRHARLRLRLGAEGQGRVMDQADPSIPQGEPRWRGSMC
jgi:GTP-binding protein